MGLLDDLVDHISGKHLCLPALLGYKLLEEELFPINFCVLFSMTVIHGS